jgi:plastocyanin
MVSGAVLVAVGAGRAAGAEAKVEVTDFAFQPAVLTVHAGTRVTWTNRDEEPHTVTSTTGAFGSPGMERGDTFAWTFDKPGTYPYRCTLHPQMKATVVVVK